MPLDRIEQMLTTQTVDYLDTPLNYNTLRANCLAIAPIDAIIKPVLERLNSTVEITTLAEDHCYPIFLTQLEHRLDSLEYLTSSEKNMLHVIILCLQQYEHIIENRLQTEAKLTNLDSELGSLRQSYANTTAKYDQLTTLNSELTQSCEQMNRALIELNPVYQHTLALRNNYSIAALVLAGISSLSAYFLIQAAPVWGPLFVIVLGVATFGLAITATGFTLIGADIHRQIKTNEQTIVNSETLIKENEQTMFECQNTLLPQLSEQIDTCQNNMVNLAPTRGKEIGLLKKAQGLSFFSIESGLSNDDLSVNDTSMTDSLDESDDDYSYLVGGVYQ